MVRGRVQGVNFRAFVATKARMLGLRGWVRNAADGRTVELYAEGSRQALEELLRHVRMGPPMARVDSVDVSWTTRPGRYEGFQIRW